MKILNLFGQYIIFKEFNYIVSLVILIKLSGEHTKMYMWNYENSVFTGMGLEYFILKWIL